MIVGMGGNCVAGGCEFYVDGSVGDDSLTPVQAGEYLVAVAVGGGSQGHLLLSVTGRIQLYVYEMVSLFLSDGLYGKAYDSVPLVRKQPYPGVCACEYVLGGVERWSRQWSGRSRADGR